MPSLLLIAIRAEKRAGILGLLRKIFGKSGALAKRNLKARNEVAAGEAADRVVEMRRAQ
jgi:hypothetical protein